MQHSDNSFWSLKDNNGTLLANYLLDYYDLSILKYTDY